MYGIISGKTLPTKFKIKVNPYQSVALQEHLFSIGGEWFSGCKLIQNIDAPFIFFLKMVKLNMTSMNGGRKNLEVLFYKKLNLKTSLNK